MDRRSLIKNAGLAGVLAAGVAPAVHAQAALRWRLASSFPKSLDTIYGAAEVFSQKVKQLSGGRFEVSVHAAGELMPAFGVVDGVQNATVEAAHTAPYYFFGKDETFAIGGAIPFGLNSRQMSAWTYEGNGLKLMREFYSKFNMISFPCGNTGAQMGGWMRKEIKGIADLKCLKFRIGGFAGKVLERLGGVPRMTTRSWDSTRSRLTTTTPAGGRAGCNSTCTSTRRPMTRCRPRTRPSSKRQAPSRTWKRRQSTM